MKSTLRSNLWRAAISRSWLDAEPGALLAMRLNGEELRDGHRCDAAERGAHEQLEQREAGFSGPA